MKKLISIAFIASLFAAPVAAQDASTTDPTAAQREAWCNSSAEAHARCYGSQPASTAANDPFASCANRTGRDYQVCVRGITALAGERTQQLRDLGRLEERLARTEADREVQLDRNQTRVRQERLRRLGLIGLVVDAID